IIVLIVIFKSATWIKLVANVVRFFSFQHQSASSCLITPLFGSVYQCYRKSFTSVIGMNKQIAQQPLLCQFDIMIQFIQLNKTNCFAFSINHKYMLLVIVQSFFNDLFALFVIVCLTVKNPIKVK